MVGGAIVFALVLVVLVVLLRKPKKDPPPVSRGPVGKPVSRGADSAELPRTEAPAVEAPAAIRREVPEALLNFHLVMADSLEPEVQARVTTICSEMAEPHPVQTQLAGGLDTPDELMEAVSSDAGLTASILRTVNSAAFSLASPITSVQHAITYLGVSVVKGLVAQAAVAERTETGTPEQQAALGRIWKSACAASAFAQVLGQELGVPRPSVLATKALFFNLGDVAIAMSVDGATEWYEEGVGIIDRIQGQQAAAGVNTAIVGAALARHWNLPEDLAASIQDGFLPLVKTPEGYPMEGAEYVQSVLMYLAGRVGDRVTYRGLRDIGELPLQDTDEPGLFYLAEHLSAAGLGRVPALLQDASFRRKANRLLTTLAA